MKKKLFVYCCYLFWMCEDGVDRREWIYLSEQDMMLRHWFYLHGSREKKKLMLYRDLDVISEISPKEHT